MLAATLQRREFVLGCFGLLIVATGALAPDIGTDFFPTSDVGILKLHMRAPRGMRLEETEKIVAEVEERSAQVIPAKELRTINATIGVPFSLNLAFVPSDNISGDERRDADFAQPRPQAHRCNTSGSIREQAEHRVPRQPVLFPDRRHRQPGAQFRPCRRRSTSRSRMRISRAPMPRRSASCARSRRMPGVVDPRILQVLDFPTHADRRRPPARRAARHRPARRRQQHADVACGQRTGRPDLLSQPADRRELHRRGADAGREDRIDRGRPEPSGQSGGAQHQSEHPADHADHAAGRTGHAHRRHRLGAARPPACSRSATTPCSASWTSPPTSTAATSAASPPRSSSIIAEVQKDLPSTVKIFLRGQNEVMETSFRNLGFGLILAIILVYARAGRAVPVLGRSVHHHDGGARRAGRHPVDPGDDRHDDQRRVADGRDHVGRHRGVELDPGGELRQRPAQPQRKPDAVSRR